MRRLPVVRDPCELGACFPNWEQCPSKARGKGDTPGVLCKSAQGVEAKRVDLHGGAKELANCASLAGNSEQGVQSGWPGLCSSCQVLHKREDNTLGLFGEVYSGGGCPVLGV